MIGLKEARRGANIVCVSFGRRHDRGERASECCPNANRRDPFRLKNPHARQTTESKILFRFRELPGELLRRVAKNPTVAGPLSRTLSKPREKLSKGLCSPTVSKLQLRIPITRSLPPSFRRLCIASQHGSASRYIHEDPFLDASLTRLRERLHPLVAACSAQYETLPSRNLVFFLQNDLQASE